MNIVILNDYGFVSGGAAEVAITSALGLALRGHKVIFFCAVGPIDSRLTAAGIDVICTDQGTIRMAPIRISPSQIKLQVQATWNRLAKRLLVERLAALDPKDTIVHLHAWTKALSPSVAQAAVERHFKIVCTLHDYSCACPRGSFFDSRRLEHCRRKALSWQCITCDCIGHGYTHKLVRTARHAVQRQGPVPERLNGFIVVTEFSRRILESYLPANKPIFEIPNPIDVSQQERVDAGENQFLTMVGRLTVEKGAPLYARAAHNCLASSVFVGDGPSRGEILSILPSAMITGWVPRTVVYEHLRRARALIFPSVMYETQGLVVAEAAALGIPSVISDGCAAAEHVGHGVSGLLFASGSLEGLIAALRQLSDDNLVRRLGAFAYQRFWEAAPTVDRHVALLERAYDVVLAAAIQPLI